MFNYWFAIFLSKFLRRILPSLHLLLESSNAINRLASDITAAQRRHPQKHPAYVFDSLKILMKRIRSSNNIPQRPFTEGQKAFVIGAPYRPRITDPVGIYAIETFADASFNRTHEINFKKELIRLYSHVFKPKIQWSANVYSSDK